MEYRKFDSTIIARIDKGEVFGGHLNRGINTPKINCRKMSKIQCLMETICEKLTIFSFSRQNCRFT